MGELGYMGHRLLLIEDEAAIQPHESFHSAEAIDWRVREIMDILLLDSPHYRIAELAQRLNLSASRLSHLFKRETGESLQQYIRAARIRRAQELLETTHLSVKEIANALGVDVSHLTRDFRQNLELTPREYRTLFHSIIPFRRRQTGTPSTSKPEPLAEAVAGRDNRVFDRVAGSANK
jgi:AraC-like DNA-binding protein